MITKNILLTLTYLVGAGELILAIYFWVTNSKNEIRRVVSLLALSTGMWVILGAVTSYVPYSTTGHYLMALDYIFGLSLLTILVHLVLIMPFPVARIDRFHIGLLYFPVVLFSYILLFSRTIVYSFQGSPTESGTITGGPLFGLYNIYLLLLFALAVIVAFVRIRKLDGLHRSNMTIFIWSVILGGSPGIFFYLVLPTFASHIAFNTLFGVIPSVIWIGGTTYIALKK